MIATDDFISRYVSEQRPQIDFAWNGKHAEEFKDINQDFRWQVVRLCIAQPELAPLNLLEHLFLADAEWAAEAWGSPHHFAELGTLLLERGQEAALDSFSHGYVRSFDTYGACHQIQLNSLLLSKLSVSATEQLTQATDEKQKKRLEAVIELLAQIEKSTAAQGWAQVGPGTPVSNIRVVWPRWYHKLWAKVLGLLRGHAT
jgi:hypothetical protein